MTNLMLDLSEHSAASGSKQTADLGELVVHPTHVIAIPARQRYYWTDGWQTGEKETLSALEEGKGIRFASGKVFSEWLLVEDDDAATPDGD